MDTNKIITMDDERIATAMQKARKASKWMSSFMKEYAPTMDGERYLTDKEVSEMLRLSRRTLQVYRTNRIIPHVMLGGKTLYPESELRKMLEKGYRKAML